MEEWMQIRQELGGVVEAAGRVLQRKSLTKEELTDLRDTLNACAETIQTVRDNLFR